MSNDGIGKKFYTMYFEGTVQIQADDDEEAVYRLHNEVSIADISYTRIAETDEGLKEIRIIEEE